MTVYRHIELNPVSAHMTDDFSGYPCSSYHQIALAQPTPLITPHEQYTLPQHLPRDRPLAASSSTNASKRITWTIFDCTASNSAPGVPNAFKARSKPGPGERPASDRAGDRPNNLRPGLNRPEPFFGPLTCSEPCEQEALTRSCGTGVRHDLWQGNRRG